MKCFLTSSPMLSDTEELNPANGFIDKLKSSLPDRCNALFVSSDPDDYIHMDRFAGSVKSAFEAAGFHSAILLCLTAGIRDLPKTW